MSFTQLNPTLPIHVIGRGDGHAFAVIDYSQEHSLVWVTVIDATGEIWCAPNEKVRFQPNWTLDRKRSEATRPPASPDGHTPPP